MSWLFALSNVINILIAISKVTLNVLAALSTMTLAIVSVIGLGTWRKKIAGAVQIETARKVILAALKTKKAIQQTRSPFGYPFEEEGLSEEQRLASNSETQAHRYSMRLKILLADNASEFELAAFEAEALWGKEAKDKTGFLQDCLNDIYRTFNLYFLLASQVETDRGMGTPRSEEDRISMTNYRKILYSPGREDEFGEKVEQAVKSIQEHFRQYLK